MSIPGFSGGSAVKGLSANAGDVRDLGSIPESGRSLEEEMATHSSILAGKSLGQRRLEGYSPWGHKRVGYDLAANTANTSAIGLAQALHQLHLDGCNCLLMASVH